MIIDTESEVLSDVEVILPREVMETCRDLQRGGTSCFLSVNKQDCTTSQLIIHRLSDDSIKIRITGTLTIQAGDCNDNIHCYKQVHKLFSATVVF